MKKQWKILLSIALVTVLITACGTGGETSENQTSGNEYENLTDAEKQVVNFEEMVTAKIELLDGQYFFTLINNSDEDIDLSFSSTQEYEYTITNSNKEHLYTYSMDKMFAEMFVERTIAPNKDYVTEVDVEYLVNLEDGTYTLEIWSVALETNDLRSKIEITINQENLGTYVGQIDNNSVEIIDSNGEPKAYRLTDEVRSSISTLETDDKVKYLFYEQDGQLFLTLIEESN
ncbi:hypothetical protein BKP37_04625 [Anaerobacillus alkalilacustris]|uniref:Intracellular proteinase inhibitor BsuPI domain-containing protein n=1 Tax=Anaerobacillus alkalilacustris TaxID=393763 RepID=A0A1S2LX95_9BACI|nr:BsuPI-related putative proteinase inhibitor [Anaerobacillus alkalilacustris]OIJ16820.1 hypothetical protein BKP37_04625 [Anaerobacillus alkalilacustris]